MRRRPDALVGEHVVMSLTDSTRIDVAVLADRSSIDLPARTTHAHVDGNRLWLETPFADPGGSSMLLDELGLDAADIELLQTEGDSYETRLLSIDVREGTMDEPLGGEVFWVGWIRTSDGELSVDWGTPGGPRSSTTTDGVRWAHETGSNERPFVIDVGPASYAEDFSGRAGVERSIDDRQTWQRSPLALRDRSPVFGPATILLGSSWGEGDDSPVTVEADDPSMLVTVTPLSEQVRVVSAEQPDVVLFETALWIERFSPWAPTFGTWVIRDVSGEELARVGFEDLDVAIHRERADHDIAFGAWPLDADEAEWRVASLRETFGDDARRVEFVAGTDAILAVVITTSGYQLFISPLSTS